jgi:adenylate kinase
LIDAVGEGPRARRGARFPSRPRRVDGRIEKRAAETKARGEPVRKDDDPEVFRTRLEAYNRDTAAVGPYYEARGHMVAIDAMKPIDEVTRAVTQALTRAKEHPFTE